VLPVRPQGFEDEEWPSGVVRRGPAPASYREELAQWFGETPDAPALKALGTGDAVPASARRMPFLIF